MADKKFEKHIERRKSRRILLELFGNLKKNNKKSECYIQNISQGGALIYYTLDAKVGDELELSFDAGKRTFTKKGYVRSIRNFSERRKYILRIGKSLDFSASMNIAFDEPMDLSDFEYIKLNA